jgi:ectoine hydroxylase
MSNTPSQDETLSFATNGYLLLEGFLAPEHIDRLRTALAEVIAQRRQLQQRDQFHCGKTAVDGDNTRIFHILGDHPLFLELLDYPPLLPYVHTLLNEHPHFHASDAIWEEGPHRGGPGWHIDGYDKGYRSLRPGIPHLQLKVGYFLSDMSLPDQGNLMIVPGSHQNDRDPTAEQLEGFATLPGAIQVCCPAGSCVLFHNALWHTRGPATRTAGQRLLLYYAYEQPWMLANPEHWQYSDKFYAGLAPAQRQFFHGFVFTPKEDRWS